MPNLETDRKDIEYCESLQPVSHRLSIVILKNENWPPWRYAKSSLSHRKIVNFLDENIQNQPDVKSLSRSC